MKARVLGLATVLLAACGPEAHAPAASSSRTAPPPATAPAAAPLIVVATGLSGVQNVPSNTGGAAVGVLDLAGQVRAQASFEPPPSYYIGNAAALVPSPIRVAAGAVFYADRTGQIHRLTADGATSVVATFALGDQQLLSFAVSPDGRHLIAILLTVPPMDTAPTQGPPPLKAGVHWLLKMETADAGGATKTTLQSDLGTDFPRPTLIAGWDDSGPLATVETYLGTQNVLPSGHLFGTGLIHIAADGTHLDRLGGPDCQAADALRDGTVLCGGFTQPQVWTVRSRSGALIWQATLAKDQFLWGSWLSPDGNAIAAQDVLVTRSGVASAARQSEFGTRLNAVGWLDAGNVVEATPSGQLALYSSSAHTKVRDLGVTGNYEGVL